MPSFDIGEYYSDRLARCDHLCLAAQVVRNLERRLSEIVARTTAIPLAQQLPHCPLILRIAVELGSPSRSQVEITVAVCPSLTIGRISRKLQSAAPESTRTSIVLSALEHHASNDVKSTRYERLEASHLGEVTCILQSYSLKANDDSQSRSLM